MKINAKQLVTVASLAVTFAVFSNNANAAPSVWPELAGSTVIIRAANPEERSYSCYVTYTYNGDGKVFNDSANFVVPAKSSNWIGVRISTSYSSSTMRVQLNSQNCS